jgi:hypothetical protein
MACRTSPYEYGAVAIQLPLGDIAEHILALCRTDAVRRSRLIASPRYTEIKPDVSIVERWRWRSR